MPLQQARPGLLHGVRDRGDIQASRGGAGLAFGLMSSPSHA